MDSQPIGSSFYKPALNWWKKQNLGTWSSLFQHFLLWSDFLHKVLLFGCSVATRWYCWTLFLCIYFLLGQINQLVKQEKKMVFVTWSHLNCWAFFFIFVQKTVFSFKNNKAFTCILINHYYHEHNQFIGYLTESCCFSSKNRNIHRRQDLLSFVLISKSYLQRDTRLIFVECSVSISSHNNLGYRCKTAFCFCFWWILKKAHSLWLGVGLMKWLIG